MMEKQISKDNLKSVFIGYRHFNGKMEKKLNSMGFSIKRQKRHIVLLLTYNGKVYTFTISVSSSDRKCGYKMVSTIMNAIK